MHGLRAEPPAAAGEIGADDDATGAVAWRAQGSAGHLRLFGVPMPARLLVPH